jgi:WXG100 family type VII secretion target
MAAPIIQGKYDDLANTAKEFGQQQDQVQQMTQAVESLVEALRGGGWYGEASVAFYAEMEDLIFPALQRLAEAMNEASGATNKIVQAFQDAEEEAGALFKDEGGALQAIGNAVSAVVGAVGGVLAGLAGKDGGPWNQIGGALKDFFADQISGAVEDAIGKYIADGPLKDALTKFLGEHAGDILGKVGGGLVSGVIDIITGNGENHPLTELASGVAQAFTGPVAVADVVIQVAGGLTSAAMDIGADWLSNGDPARAQEIRDSLQIFNDGLEQFNLDNRMDGLIGGIGQNYVDVFNNPSLENIAMLPFRNAGVILSEAGTIVRGAGNLIIGGQQIQNNIITSVVGAITGDAATANQAGSMVTQMWNSVGNGFNSALDFIGVPR